MEYRNVLSFLAALLIPAQLGLSQGLKPPSPLRQDVANAKAHGLTAFSIIPPAKMATGVDSVSSFVNQYAVVVVEPVSRAVIESATELITWYSLKLDELVSSQSKIPDDFPLGVPPVELLKDESRIFLPMDGGTMIIDGISVSERGVDLTLGSRYLMILYLTSGGKVGQLAAGSSAVFELDSSNDFVPIRPSRLALDIKRLFPKGLTDARDYFRHTSK